MARNIQEAGYSMVVHDAREEATRPLLEGGAKLATSPAEVAALCDVTFTSLPGPPQVEEVVDGRDGILEGIKEGAVYLDLSSCGPDLLRRLEPKFRQQGAHLMDTPVLSSPARAIDRSLIVMAGGERNVFERVQPLLEAFADKVVYTGGLGTACICKLVNNMMSFAIQQLVAEGLTLGLQAGVDLDVLMDTGSRGLLGARVCLKPCSVDNSSRRVSRWHLPSKTSPWQPSWAGRTMSLCVWLTLPSRSCDRALTGAGPKTTIPRPSCSRRKRLE